MAKKYTLVGVASTSDTPYGFARPVFQDKKGNKFFGISNSKLEYEQFEIVKSKTCVRKLDSFKNKNIEIDGITEYTNNSKAIYGFMFDRDNLYLGSIDNMYEFLISHDFSDNQQVQKETIKYKKEIEGYQKSIGSNYYM